VVTDDPATKRQRFYTFFMLAHKWRTHFLAKMEAVSLECGLTLAETLATLRLLQGPATVSELATTAAIRRNGASVLVDRLEARGIVTRQRGKADRRVVQVRLTEQGQSLVSNTVLACFGEQMDALFAPLSDQERAQWLSYIQRVTSS
jgi:DNA-binding MarR family transcriptional regulator